MIQLSPAVVRPEALEIGTDAGNAVGTHESHIRGMAL
jgi:hypothetical protein